MTHICVGNLTSIGPDNGLAPGQRQAIIWTNAGMLLIGPWRTNFSKILSQIHTFSFNKMHLKMLSGKWRPFCLGLNVLRPAPVYHDIAYITAVTEYKSEIEATKGSPYLVLTSKLCSVFYEDFGKNWLHYHSITLYVFFPIYQGWYTWWQGDHHTISEGSLQDMCVNWLVHHHNRPQQAANYVHDYQDVKLIFLKYTFFLKWAWKL